MNGKAIKRAAFGVAVSAAAGIGAAVLAGGAAAQAAPATLAKQVAYVRAGVIYLSKGTGEVRLTEDEVNARPRFSPDGKRIAYLHNGTVWVMKADGSGKKQVSDRIGGGPAWSPDGKWIAFSGQSCTGGPGVFRVPSAGGATAQPLFPASCRDQEVPEVAYITGMPAVAPAAGLAERLRTDDAVAWSPDGKKLAFRGGECENIADDCLSVGDVASGGESAIDVYGGGGQIESGFGVVPAWRGDGKKVSWTAYTDGGATIRVQEADTTGANRRQVGQAEDREMVYLDSRRGVLTGTHQGRSWVTVLDLSTGKRTPFRQGSQPSVRP